MRVLVFGTTGQVATALREYGEVIAVGRDQADLTVSGVCAGIVCRAAPDVVVNAAAYTAVDQAEQEEALALQINATAPGAIAVAAARHNIPMIQISTDYVFDGTGVTGFAPDAPTNPIGAYGRTKLAGEKVVMAASDRHIVLRTSWVFSVVGSNFVKTMLRLGRENSALDVVDDQVGGPTPATAIAAACMQMATKLHAGSQRGGIYHFSGAPDVNWADFARTIFAEAGLRVEVRNVPTSAFPRPAKRPANSRLDCATLEREFGIQRPDWRQGLRDVLNALEV